MTVRELGFLLIGVGITLILGLVKVKVQSLLASRAEKIERHEAAAQQRALELRQKLEIPASAADLRLDADGAFAALFSDNGFEIIERAGPEVPEMEENLPVEAAHAANEETAAEASSQEQDRDTKTRKGRKLNRPAKPTIGGTADVTG